MSKRAKKLGADKTYKRPKVTHQEKLSAEEIEEKLEGYVKVDDIAEVPLNTHMRYFTITKDGSHVFRLGGFLQNKQNAEKYVMLGNGKQVWSVQVKDSIFYRKMSHKEEIDKIHEYYKEKLDKKDQVIAKLKEYVRKTMASKSAAAQETKSGNSNTKSTGQAASKPVASSKSTKSSSIETKPAASAAKTTRSSTREQAKPISASGTSRSTAAAQAAGPFGSKTAKPKTPSANRRQRH